MKELLKNFDSVWLVDFEFHAPDGERPQPICLVAHELHSNQTLKFWQDELTALLGPPYPISAKSLMVAYYASAEIGCHISLGWLIPSRILDLYVEFRWLTNGLRTYCGNSLLGALAHFGIEGIESAEKSDMRNLAIRGGPWTPEEQSALLNYCESDVLALKKLIPKMTPRIDLPRALLRGRYVASVARMENTGVPVDTPTLRKVRQAWPQIQERLIARIDKDYGIFEGKTFKTQKFDQWLGSNNIPWPRLPSGKLALDDNTFREMSRAYPELNPIRELRISLSQLRLENLSIGSDGRNRTLLSPFGARSGRNTPSNAKFIFGPAVWLRNLIEPQPGFGLAYVDYEQQEFGIAAVLSRDEKMIEAYRTGDPYLAFAKQAGAIPLDATKQTHGVVRDLFKTCALGVQYGMGAESLARRLAKSVVEARELLAAHRRVYAQFWTWSEAVVRHALILNRLYSVFNWQIQLSSGSNINPRSLMNFPMQANGAEMLRLACCLATEGGISVCAPVHDAILIEAPLAELDDAISRTQKAMRDASAAVLSGFDLRTEAKIIRWPDHYEDQRGNMMWRTVCELIGQYEIERGLHTPRETDSVISHVHF